MGIQITDAANTFNIALHILASKGYTVNLRPQEEILFYAKSAIEEYYSTDPLSLLAIVDLKEKTVPEYYETEYINNNILNAIKELITGGYILKITNDYSDSWFDWIAMKNEDLIIAKTPLKLLALVIIIKIYGENWRDQEIPNYYTDLFKNT